ncbi:MAG TPA: efflux RND transporter periplasmic adaptor subunit [Kiritimatiellia bacterium]|nr:efflux RND transporter periplasmic adaptor subunit [Kiritimatiellia bacterium]HRU71328.1 efflux RND transporter periplasmic adaptor subunit [Kiritimatiellia bacterium]
MKVFLFLIVLGSIAAGGWYYYQKSHAQGSDTGYRTAVVQRDTIVQEIRATGTVEPIKEVEVGTQVNGRILQLYVDYNSTVTTNQVIALIDPAVYEATHAKDLAQLKSNQANVEQIAAKLSLAEKDLVRKTELAARNMLSKADLDAALAERDALAAQLKVAEAAVEQSQAAVKLSKTNLDYCTIRSPVNGVVIARNVDEGQTVVSSMNAQQLYQIATDLSRIQVSASVPEADVGLIRTNQPVTFTVDAYRDTFRGTVKQIRLAATTVQNVVTYPVIVEADNPGEKLFPGMTANIAIEVARSENAQFVPAAALRFNPTNLVTDIRGPKIWLLNTNGVPEAAQVKLGISDGTRNVIVSPDGLDGREVVLGFKTNGSADSGGPKNPFMPTPPGSTQSRNARRAMR